MVAFILSSSFVQNKGNEDDIEKPEAADPVPYAPESYPEQNDEGGDMMEGDEEYEEGGEIHEQLLGSKLARKRAQEDARLLSNRLKLLKLEEQKVN